MSHITNAILLIYATGMLLMFIDQLVTLLRQLIYNAWCTDMMPLLPKPLKGSR